MEQISVFVKDYIVNNSYEECIYGNTSNNIYLDKCLTNENFNNSLKIYHRSFLNYFIYDIFVMIYQVYKNINKNIRMDLLFHHNLKKLFCFLINLHYLNYYF